MGSQEHEGAVGQVQGHQVRYDGEPHAQGRPGVAAVALRTTASQAHDEPDGGRGGIARRQSRQVALRRRMPGQQGEPQQRPAEGGGQ